MKQMIEKMMNEPEDLFDLLNTPSSGLTSNVEVYNFHEWLRNSLQMKDGEIPALLDKVNKGEAILPAYDAIMIDEGQDFEAD